MRVVPRKIWLSSLFRDGSLSFSCGVNKKGVIERIMEKTYNPGVIEKKWQKFWEDNNTF